MSTQNTFVLRGKSLKVRYLCGYVRGFESKTIPLPILFPIRKSCSTSQAVSRRPFAAEAQVRACGICGGHTCWAHIRTISNFPYHYHSTNVPCSYFIQLLAVSLSHVPPTLQKSNTETVATMGVLTIWNGKQPIVTCVSETVDVKYSLRQVRTQNLSLGGGGG
jgi:hypothetical protein